MARRTSFFNWGLSRSWLKRCWPLWTAYLAEWLIALPQSVPELRRYSDILSYTAAVNRSVVSFGQSMAQASIIVGIIAAMVMYSYMYSSRACGMMNALPVRRETVFTTAFVTGLAPLLLADVIIIGAVCAVYARTGVVETKNVFLALGFAVMGNVAFFGFATFCAVLTGSLVVLPAVYLVLGFAAAVAEYAVHVVLGSLMYGFNAGVSYGTALSPIVAVADNISVSQETVNTADGRYELTGGLVVNGTALIAAYCAAGLILAVCALFIYRRRDMERAGDVVAIPVLKPIFKYCMTFGCAMFLGYGIYPRAGDKSGAFQRRLRCPPRRGDGAGRAGDAACRRIRGVLRLGNADAEDAARVSRALARLCRVVRGHHRADAGGGAGRDRV